MKKHIQIGMFISVILFAALLVNGCGEGAYVTQKITTEGTVTVKDKDAAGKVKSVEIKADDKPAFLVQNSGKGKELLRIIGKKVEVNGAVRETSGVKIIKVESYKLIN